MKRRIGIITRSTGIVSLFVEFIEYNVIKLDYDSVLEMLSYYNLNHTVCFARSL